MQTLAGVIELPSEILVTGGVLGQRFHGEAGALSFELSMPLYGGDRELCRPLDVPPRLRAPDPNYGFVANDVTDSRPISDCAVRVYAVGFSSISSRDESLADHDEAWEMGRSFDAWFETVAELLALWSGQGVSMDAPPSRRSVGHATSDPSKPGLTGWGSGGTTYVVHEKALTAEEFGEACRRGNHEQKPPEPWLFYLRASRTADTRRAVIEAATAAEVCLAEAIHVRLPDVPDSARERIIQDCNGLVGMLRLIESFDSEPDSKASRVMHRIARPRNQAAHAGLTPSGADFRNALAEVHAILSRYVPIAPPALIR